MADTILSINAGSSSLKVALHAIDGEALVLRFRDTLDGPPDGPGVMPRVLARAGERPGDRLVAAGHRVVHGGRAFTWPVLLDAAVLAELDALTPLAPLHQPPALNAIRALTRARPALAQVACFDTAFHAGHAPEVSRFGLNRELEAEGIRRYGFHGLSYEYIAGRLTLEHPALAAGRVVVAHLGNGASLCALKAGRSVDTTMSLTALDGLVMGTRCGALDPGVVLYLLQAKGMTAAQIEDLLYHRSGLLGVSGVSGDMRALIASDHPAAREAIELFTFRIARETAAMANSLGGLDGLVFTGGIGEHAAPVRAAVCERLAWLGVILAPAANRRGAGLISAPESPVAVRMIPTDEEHMLALHARDTTRAPRPTV